MKKLIKKILKEETEDGMKDIMFDIFDENTKGAEIYEYNDSLWMVLPEENEWVFYISKNGNLWYNYYFFKKIYRYVSLNVIDNQHYITEWVEDIIKTGVRHTQWALADTRALVEDIIKTGVRHTQQNPVQGFIYVEDIIEKGEKIE